MKTLLAIAGLLALPAASYAQDCCERPYHRTEVRHVEHCYPRTVEETYYVQVPYTYWTFDCCRGWTLHTGYRCEARTRCRTIWVCEPGCGNPYHHREERFRDRCDDPFRTSYRDPFRD
jgi:hypothetical protein